MNMYFCTLDTKNFQILIEGRRSSCNNNNTDKIDKLEIAKHTLIYANSHPLKYFYGLKCLDLS
jgi:hypothetical protein